MQAGVGWGVKEAPEGVDKWSRPAQGQGLWARRVKMVARRGSYGSCGHRRHGWELLAGALRWFKGGGRAQRGGKG